MDDLVAVSSPLQPVTVIVKDSAERTAIEQQIFIVDRVLARLPWWRWFARRPHIKVRNALVEQLGQCMSDVTIKPGETAVFRSDGVSWTQVR